MDSWQDYSDINRIVSTYSAMLLRVAYANTGNRADAEDIAQEVFVRLMRTRPVFNSTEHEKAWLLRVAINLCKNHLRSGWVTKTTPLEDAPVQDGDSELLAVVMNLPQHYRSAIYLYYYEGYSTKELASILGRRQSTICTWLSRARELLRADLVEMEGGK